MIEGESTRIDSAEEWSVEIGKVEKCWNPVLKVDKPSYAIRTGKVESAETQFRKLTNRILQPAKLRKELFGPLKFENQKIWI